MQIITYSELVEKPWKNGGGITREIADCHEGGQLKWRLSMADVASDGAFSDFAGLARVLTVIEGAGMDLIAPDRVLHAAYAVPVAFDGATPITSRLIDGPLRDLNLMFAPTLCRGDVTALHGPQRARFPGAPGQTLALHCVAGPVRAGDVTLAQGDTALIHDAALQVTCDAGAIALLITLRAI